MTVNIMDLARMIADLGPQERAELEKRVATITAQREGHKDPLGEEGLASAERRERWRRENVEAIRFYNEIVEREGLPLNDFRTF